MYVKIVSNHPTRFLCVYICQQIKSAACVKAELNNKHSQAVRNAMEFQMLQLNNLVAAMRTLTPMIYTSSFLAGLFY